MVLKIWNNKKIFQPLFKYFKVLPILKFRRNIDLEKIVKMIIIQRTLDINVEFV